VSGTLRIIQGAPTTGKSNAAEAWRMEDPISRVVVGRIEDALSWLISGFDVAVDDERLQTYVTKIEVRVMKRDRCPFVGERVLNEGKRYESVVQAQCSLDGGHEEPHRWGGKDFEPSALATSIARHPAGKARA
jgi:hypothetical protein